MITYTENSREIRGTTLWTNVSYLIDDQIITVDVPHSIFGLTAEVITSNIEARGLTEKARLDAIEAAKLLL